MLQPARPIENLISITNGRTWFKNSFFNGLSVFKFKLIQFISQILNMACLELG